MLTYFCNQLKKFNLLKFNKSKSQNTLTPFSSGKCLHVKNMAEWWENPWVLMPRNVTSSPTNRITVDRSKWIRCFEALPVSVSEFNETEAREYRRNYRKQSRLNYRQIIKLTRYRKTASGIVSGITKTAIFTLPHNVMSKPDTNNTLLAKVHFPTATLHTLYISTIAVVLLSFCEIPVVSLQIMYTVNLSLIISRFPLSPCS